MVCLEVVRVPSEEISDAEDEGDDIVCARVRRVKLEGTLELFQPYINPIPPSQKIPTTRCCISLLMQVAVCGGDEHRRLLTVESGGTRIQDTQIKTIPIESQLSADSNGIIKSTLLPEQV